MDEWELSKENVLPLKQGRKAGNLSAALQPSNTDKSRLLLSERQDFETELRSYQGDDTLDPWYRYFKWTLRNFPQGGKDSNLTTLLERCFKHFQSETKYYNDLRFVEIWLQMATMSNHALECYQFMKDQGIGTQCSQFYESWAWELEQLGNTKKADSIYTDGLRNHAQPQERLDKMHKEFQSRVSRVTLTQIQEGGMQPAVQQEQRTTLGGLRGRGKHHKVGTQRTGAAKAVALGPQNLSRPMPLGQNSNKPVQIFCDDENDRGTALPGTNKQWKSLPTQNVLNKENTVEPGPWNSQSIPHRGGTMAAAAAAPLKPTFFIHEDADAKMQTPHKPPEMNSHVLSDRKHEPGARSLPFVPEDPNPNAKVMYCKHLVYVGTTEMSFEELRAIKYNEKKEKERLRVESENLKARQALLQQREQELMQREMELLRQRDEQQQMVIRRQQQELQERQSRQQEMMFNRQQEEMMRKQKDMLLHAQREKLQKMPVEDIAMETNRPMEIPSQKRDSCGSSESNISCTQRLMFDDVTATQTAGLPHVAPPHHQDEVRIPSGLTPGSNITPNCSMPLNASNVSQPKTPSDVASLDSSHNRSNLLTRLGSGRTPKGLTQPSPTINTKEALDVIMGALNESLGDVHIGSKLSVLPEEPLMVETIAPTSNSFVHHDASSAFCPVSQTKPRGLSVQNPLGGFVNQKWDGEIFVDPTVNIETECRKDEECKENRPPDDYQQYKENRGQLTVLQPAVGVPVDPDSAPGQEPDELDVEPMGHEQSDHGAIPKTNTTTRFQDSTIFHTTNGNISFSTASHLASTPFNGAASLFAPPMSVIKKNGGEASFQDEEEVEGMDTDRAGPQRSNIRCDENESLESKEYPDHLCENKVLSPIIETSAEDGRSSSSSSSASSSSSSSSNHVSQQKTLHAATLPSISESSFVGGELSEAAANITLRRGSKRQASVEEEMEIPTAVLDDQVLPANGVQLPGTPGPKSLAEELSDALGGQGDDSMLDEEDHRDVDVRMREDATAGDIANGNPFKEELKSLLLSKLSKPLASYDGFTWTDDSLPSFDNGSTVGINDGQMAFLVSGQCGEGAFAKIFEVQPLLFMVGTTKDKVLKVQKPACPWEFYISRVSHERIGSLGSGKHVLDSLMFADAITVHPEGSCLVMDHHGSGTLLDLINHYQKRGEKMTEKMVALFAITILDIVDALHSSQIIHADIKPDNFMLQNLHEGRGESCLKLIDFGQSIDMSLFPENTTFNANCHTSAFSCVEMQTGKPWTYQTDYYGIAGTFHCMLFNTYMKVYQEGNIWKTTALFKRSYKCGWKGIFLTLLNVPSCDPSDLVSLKEIRAQLNTERNKKYTLEMMKEELNTELLE